MTANPAENSITVGPPIRDIIRGCLPHIEDSEMETIVSEFRKRYDDSEFFHTRPYPEITEVLDALHEHQHFIVTNKPSYPTARLLNKLGWKMLFKDVYTPNRRGSDNLLPKTVLISLALEEHGLSPESCFFVSDTVSDVKAAHANGVQAIGVAWGYEHPSALSDCGADWIAHIPTDIIRFVNGNANE